MTNRQFGEVCTAEAREAFDAAALAPLFLFRGGEKTTHEAKPEAAAHCWQTFQATRAAFLRGEITPTAAVDTFHELLVAASAAFTAAATADAGLVKGDANGVPCDAMKAFLHSLGGDDEREATLHAAYLRRFPDIHTTCCKRRHCFRCHIKDFHDGITCEAFQAQRAQVENVVACPGCGLQLTKGDGCNSVNCVCGRNFDWASELKKVHESLAAAFVSEHRGLPESELAKSVALAEFFGVSGESPPLETSASASAAAGAAAATDESQSARRESSMVTGSDGAGFKVRAAAWAAVNPQPVSKQRAALFQRFVVPHVPFHARGFPAHQLTKASPLPVFLRKLGFAAREVLVAQSWATCHAQELVKAKQGVQAAQARLWTALFATPMLPTATTAAAVVAVPPASSVNAETAAAATAAAAAWRVARRKASAFPCVALFPEVEGARSLWVGLHSKEYEAAKRECKAAAVRAWEALHSSACAFGASSSSSFSSSSSSSHCFAAGAAVDAQDRKLGETASKAAAVNLLGDVRTELFNAFVAAKPSELHRERERRFEALFHQHAASEIKAAAAAAAAAAAVGLSHQAAA